MKTVSIKVDDRLYALLEARSKEEGGTISGVVRSLVHSCIASVQKDQQAPVCCALDQQVLREIRALALWAVASLMKADASLGERLDAVRHSLNDVVERAEK